MSISQPSLVELLQAIESGLYTDTVKELLSKSLFYYCSGKDATPIAALGTRVPLYIYSDSFIYMKQTFHEATESLYSRIQKQGYKLCEAHQVKLTSAQNAALTLWELDRECRFILLYTQSDAIALYKSIYLSAEPPLRPRYFCNYRYEMGNRGIIEREESRALYVMGYCHSPNFECIAEYGYLGDYSFGRPTTVKLYRHNTISDNAQYDL